MLENRFPWRPILAVTLIVPVPSLGTAWALWWGGAETSGNLVYLVCKLWLLAVPLIWLLKVERSRASFSPARRGGFGSAVVLGLLIAGLILAVYWFIGRNWIDADQLAELGDQHHFLILL